MDEKEARALLDDCMRVLYYRDCRTINSFQVATVTKATGVQISEPFSLETSWNFQRQVHPDAQSAKDLVDVEIKQEAKF
jgi:20S proteasome subunit beta 7